MTFIFAILAGLSLLLALWQWVAASRFPLHQRIQPKPSVPSVTILKPLKGLDDNTIGCLRTWLTQTYPGKLEVLFGVASPDDPACEPVRQLLKAHPGCDVTDR